MEVFDGDTVLLEGGRKIRLGGVNTPEVAHQGRPAQPLAEEARQALQAWVAAAGQVRLVAGNRDHYGRWIGHLYNAAGESAEAMLVRRGLAWVVVVAPEVAFWPCLAAAEQESRRRQSGLWASPYDEPVAVTSALGRGGFMRIRGRVSAVGGSGDRPTLVLDDRVLVRVQKHYQQYGDVPDQQWLGRDLVVRGWVVPLKKTHRSGTNDRVRWLVQVSHPGMVEAGGMSR